ncbi:hypothetical protein [Methylobacterium sp. yr668]|uniref:hypothetical protein n=1 Tax=Methylobacterium sp. yr668 TaxID=1761801 RepID=UPI0008E606BA|nr:hypothetical protein [Methylobacterium sp. yr668]SFT26613.1 hypothetical protein SAMN04487845_13614 [Methylobacterium sp. yr668]
MTTTTCSGTVIALGQSELSLQGRRYAYIEIERQDGRILRADDVVVLNEVGSLLHEGVQGRFHFDAARLKTATIRQLFGIRRSDGRWGYDAAQVRVTAAIHNIVQGALTAFVFVGIPFLLLGLLQLVYSIGTARLRHDEFFGSEAQGDGPKRRDEVIRI